MEITYLAPHEVLDAKTPQAAIGVEGGDTRVDARCVPLTVTRIVQLADVLFPLAGS
jgi:hypothetical protein